MTTNMNFAKTTNTHKHDYSEYEQRFERENRKKIRKEEKNKNRKTPRYDDEEVFWEDEIYND